MQSRINKNITDIEKTLNVGIHYDLSKKGFFPKEWLQAPVSAKAERIKISDLLRATETIKRFFEAYPRKLIQNNLSNIYLVQKLNDLPPKNRYGFWGEGHDY
jgi:hypothetical protein